MIKKIQDFIQSVQTEMKKVTWPTLEELKGSTWVVVLFSIVLSVFLFIVDFVLTKAVQIII